MILSGAVTGGLFAILASGLVLTYLVSGVFNFAYGSIAFVAALTFFELHTGSNWPTAVAALVTVLGFGPLLGALLDLAMFPKIGPGRHHGADRGDDRSDHRATRRWVVHRPADASAQRERRQQPARRRSGQPTVWHLTDKVSLDSNQVAVLAAAGATALLLWFIVRRTPLGLQMRACVDRRDSHHCEVWTRADRPSPLDAVDDARRAGRCARRALPVAGFRSFTQAMLVSAAAAVFARLTSIPIAFLGGLAIGVVENLVAG